MSGTKPIGDRMRALLTVRLPRTMNAQTQTAAARLRRRSAEGNNRPYRLDALVTGPFVERKLHLGLVVGWYYYQPTVAQTDAFDLVYATSKTRRPPYGSRLASFCAWSWSCALLVP